MKFVFVIIGGGLGAGVRYGINELTIRLWGAAFPAGTLIVNLLGCLLIGLSFGLAGRAGWFTPEIRLFFITGFLGALTTFSTFALETVHAAQSGSSHQALAIVLLHNTMGLLAVMAGLFLSRGLIR